MSKIEARIAKLETRQAEADMPAYLSFATAEDLETYDGPMPGKVYIGISPDDWDTEADHATT